MTRFLIAWAGFVLTAGCAVTQHASPATRLHPCALAEGPADADCGLVPVWENRAAHSGRRIELKVILLPAFKPADTATPLFVLAGGPGQGAAALVDTWQRLLLPVQRDRDIVLIDTRGTGASHPLACNADLGRGNHEPKAAVDALRGCLSAYRDYADVTQYTTSNAMDDIDDIREFLGYSTVDLYGVSFGTRAAMVYLKRHSSRVHAVVLDSVAPPENGFPLFLARDAQRAFDLLVRDCDRDADCHARFPDLAVRFARLLARLATAPLHVRYADRRGVSQDLEVTRSRVAGIVLNALYVPELSANIPFLIEQADHGDFTGLLALEDVTTPVRASIAMGLQHSVLCAEDVTSPLGRGTAPDGAGTFIGPDAIQAAERICSVWPVAAVGADYWQPTHTEAPALLISGELDPVTPPEWADLVARRWPNAQRIVVPGSAHNASASECVVTVMAAFLRASSAVAPDAACIAAHRRPPFVLDASGPSVGAEHSR